MVHLKAPWNERNGKFSPMKAIVFAGLFVPAAWIALYGGDRRARAQGRHRDDPSGWACGRSDFLLLVAARDPADPLGALSEFVAIRRMVGVAAFAYATGHLCLYVVDQHFNLAHVASEIALRFYLTIGFVAWLGLAALAATSTDAMIRRLGPKWRTLHSLVYAIGVLALLHFMIQAKADVTEPVIMTGLFLTLMLFRVALKRGAPAWGAALIGAVVAPPAHRADRGRTWYALVRHIPFQEVIEANWDWDMAFRPSAYVLAGGAALLAVAILRRAPQAKRAAAVAPRAASSAAR